MAEKRDNTTMTRTFATTAVALSAGLLLGVAACAGSPGPGTSVAERSASDATARVVPGDGDGSASLATAEAPVVVYTVGIEASLKEDYKTLAQLAASPSVRLVVSGEVVEAAPVYQGQIARTKLAVRVAKSSSGSVAVGSTVVIYRDGGLIPLSWVLPEYKSDPRFDQSKLPASPPPNAVVDMRFLDAEQSAVGDKIVAFLCPNPNAGEAGTYMIVSSVHGLLNLDRETGRYNRLLGDDEKRAGYEASASTAAVEEFTRRRS